MKRSVELDRLLINLKAQGIRDEQVLHALASVPRNRFIDEAFAHK
ncbi:MAG: protein-L-isoaspartate(D-aspartate) O-methyltransferase, partial [Plesiomonas sp.]